MLTISTIIVNIKMLKTQHGKGWYYIPMRFEQLLRHHHILALAPMDGYTDQPFRHICRQHGAQLLYSEFINGIDVVYHTRYERQKIIFSEFERPFGIQLYDHDEMRLIEAASIVESYAPDFIDINLGCSIKDIKNRGAGAGLLREPGKVDRIFAALSKRIHLPITAKIRLGWDMSSQNYLEIIKILESHGVCLVAVHARTADQTFNNLPDFSCYEKIRGQTTLPILANGDVGKLHALSCVKISEIVNGLMIGRAAIGNPWVFSTSLPRPDDVLNSVKAHLCLMVGFYGELTGIRLFRKHLVKYLSRYSPTGRQKAELLTCEDSDVLIKRIDNFFIENCLL